MADDGLTKEQKILREATERLRLAESSESHFRQLALDDLKFVAGDQWPQSIKTGRDLDDRPCLTSNKVSQFVRQVVNDGRQNKPSIKVHPAGDGATEGTAKILSGIIRDIEQTHDADLAYDTALESAARMGLGYFRVTTDYVSEDTFDQEIKIERIRNTLKVYFDPASEDPAGRDATHAFISNWIPRKAYNIDWPSSELSDFDLTGLGDNAPMWMQGDDVRIVEYYSLEKRDKTLALLKDQSKVYLEDTQREIKPEEIVASRKVKVTRCIWRLLSGAGQLDETEIPSRYIPILRVIGDEFDIEGKVTFAGLTRAMQDPQRMYNYWLTSATEEVALRPKAPYIGVAGQFEGQEQKWRQANQRTFAYLEYNPVTINGAAAPMPQRQEFSGVPADILQMAAVATDDMKAVTGIYDAGLGARSNETSGKAIMARQREADTSTFHYIDNLARAIRHAGRIIVEMIPRVYDTPRVVRILNEDETERMVNINPAPGAMARAEEAGQEIKGIYDLRVGRYGVRVSVGPSFTTKRQEAAESMISFVQAVPAAGQMVADLIAKNMDWPGADDIAKRIRTMLPPGMQDDEAEEEIPLAQAQQMVQQAVQEAIQQAAQQFQQSVEQQEVDIKEFEAMTKRMDMLADQVQQAGDIRDQVRNMVAEAFAEIMSQGGQIAPTTRQ